MAVKHSIFVACLVVVSGLLSCADRATDPTPAQNGEVTLYFGKAPVGVHQIIARLTRPRFADRVLNMMIADTGRTASGSIRDVEVGLWHLRVDAVDSLGSVKYTGETDVDVVPGQLTPVSMELSATTGDVVIIVTWGGSCVPVLRSIVSWWSGDGNGNDKTGRNDGVLMDSVVFGQGKVGRSFVLDGVRSFVYIPDAPSLNPVGSFSVESWIFPTADVSSNLIAKWRDDAGAVNQRSWQMGIRQGRSVRFAISDSAHQHDGSFHVFDSDPGVITLNAWNHVACVYDQNSGRRIIYVNGKKVAERTDTPIEILHSTSEVTLGAIRIPGSPYNYAFFAGKIDEMSFYDGALSQDQIQSIYKAGSAGKCR